MSKAELNENRAIGQRVESTNDMIQMPNNIPADFRHLVNLIQRTSSFLREHAWSVINRDVTVRAWLTGYFIVEYEQKGNDRAKYGEQLLKNLSKQLNNKGFSETELRQYRTFYQCYPQLTSPIFQYLSSAVEKQQSVSAIFQLPTIQKNDSIQQTVSAISCDGFAMRLNDGSVKPVPQMLFDRLSYSHFVKLIHVENELERTFLAIETMRGPWSVRELKRQIDSNYFERSGWSKRPDLLAARLEGNITTDSFAHSIHSPYVFEFLDLKGKQTIEENDVEDAIVEHFQDFIMEMGVGLCLEARQKKILIDDDYKKADLVFYHRVLKCHIIVELKARTLEYGDVMQLNLYMNYYRMHYMQPDDNPPIGLLLCTAYGQEMVEYLTPFTDPQLFIARYELALPSKEKIQDFLMRENKQ